MALITYSRDNPLAFGTSIACVITLFLIWPLFSLRVYVRACMVRSYGLDDWFMAASVITFTAYAALTIAMHEYAPFTSVRLTIPELMHYMTLYHTMILLLIVQWICFRLSLAFQFLRLIPEKWERFLVYVATGIVTSIGIVHFIFNLFICGTPNKYAEVLFTEPHRCYPELIDKTLLYVMITLGVLFDFIVVGLPLRQVATSRTMTTRSKLTVSIILFMFITGAIASIVRLAALHEMFDKPIVQKGDVASLMGVVEPALFVIGGCLGTLRPLVRKVIGRKQSASLTTGTVTGSYPMSPRETKHKVADSWSEIPAEESSEKRSSSIQS